MTFAPGLRRAVPVRGVAAADPARTVPALDAALRYDPLSTLGKVRAPVHCINTDFRATDVRGDVQATKRHLARFGVEVMPGLGHFPQLEDPAGFNARLERALSTLTT